MIQNFWFKNNFKKRKKKHNLQQIDFKSVQYPDDIYRLIYQIQCFCMFFGYKTNKNTLTYKISCDERNLSGKFDLLMTKIFERNKKKRDLCQIYTVIESTFSVLQVFLFVFQVLVMAPSRK